jgi:hypothetical protein
VQLSARTPTSLAFPAVACFSHVVALQSAREGTALLKHLFDSQGRAVAYVHEGGVFLYSNRFVGRLDDNEVWHGTYVGEIVSGT